MEWEVEELIGMEVHESWCLQWIVVEGVVNECTRGFYFTFIS